MTLRLGSYLLYSLATVVWTLAVVGCGNTPPPLAPEFEERGVTAAMLSDFIEHRSSRGWSKIYVSGQYVSFQIDSGFLRDLPRIEVPYVVAPRAIAEESPDIIRDGGLLLEPLATRRQSDGTLSQALNYSATSDYGGMLVYQIRSLAGRWIIVKLTRIWEI